MSRSSGTGQPITFKCSECRKSGGAYAPERRRMGLNTVRTGRTAPLASSQRGRGGARVMQERHEYRCNTCSHVGWTRHKDILRKPIGCATCGKALAGEVKFKRGVLGPGGLPHVAWERSYCSVACMYKEDE